MSVKVPPISTATRNRLTLVVPRGRLSNPARPTALSARVRGVSAPSRSSPSPRLLLYRSRCRACHDDTLVSACPGLALLPRARSGSWPTFGLLEEVLADAPSMCYREARLSQTRRVRRHLELVKPEDERPVEPVRSIAGPQVCEHVSAPLLAFGAYFLDEAVDLHFVAE